MGQMMQFAEFRLDLAEGRLWRDGEPQDLTPKALALLEVLVSHPQQLVAKERLLDAVWGDTFVGEAVLKVAIAELRKVLGDDPKAPRFIETVHRRGYRFVAAEAPVAQTPGLVGREAALVHLRVALREAMEGQRQTVFVTGEAGIGKSALLEAFLRGVPGHVLVARGQCLQQYGQGEPYLPVLDALGRLASAPGLDNFAALLDRHAPTWLAQMPALRAGLNQEALAREVLGATRERMLREMAEAIEALTATRPLVLALEDLHWSDLSTVDLLSALAWRPLAARLLLVGTYRPVEVVVSDHPIRSLKRDLAVQGRAAELALDLLDGQDVERLIAARCPGHSFPPDFVGWLQERTGGNPLFLVNVLDFAATRQNGSWHLRAPLEQLAVEVPDSLRQMIERQVDRLTAGEQAVLEASAVAGMDFSVVAVGAGLEQDPLVVEESCERLARQGLFLRSGGLSELPDGTVAARFAFLHPLYQTVLYQRIGAGRRIRLHQRIGEQGERVYGARAREIAAELAVQFESARDHGRAVKYLRWAAANAVQRYANREAADLLTRALEAAGRLSAPERAGLEQALFERRGLVCRAMGEMTVAAQEFAAAAECARAQADTAAQVRALLYRVSALSWVDHDACLMAANEAVTLSAAVNDETVRAHARGYCGYWHLVLRGWRDEDAAASREAMRVLRAANEPGLLALHVVRHSYFESLRADYGQAAGTAQEGMHLAAAAGDAFDYMLAQYFRAWALFFNGRWGELRAVLNQAIALAARNEHRRWAVIFRLQLAWLHAEVEAYAEARELTAAALAEAREMQHPFSVQIGLVLLGLAHLGLDALESAHGCFEELADWSARERILMDWIWQIPLRLGQSRCALRRGDLAAARGYAADACARAGVPGEGTWLALGHLELARIGHAAGDDDEIERELRAALAGTLGELPLAAWRVREFAAGLNASAGHGDRVREMVAGLRESLGEGDELRYSPLFRRVLGERAAGA